MLTVDRKVLLANCMTMAGVMSPSILGHRVSSLPPFWHRQQQQQQFQVLGVAVHPFSRLTYVLYRLKQPPPVFTFEVLDSAIYFDASSLCTGCSDNAKQHYFPFWSHRAYCWPPPFIFFAHILHNKSLGWTNITWWARRPPITNSAGTSHSSCGSARVSWSWRSPFSHNLYSSNAICWKRWRYSRYDCDWFFCGGPALPCVGRPADSMVVAVCWRKIHLMEQQKKTSGVTIL